MRDDADVGMRGFSEDFFSFEEYYEWYQQNLSKCGIVSFTWSDLTEIKIEYDTIYFRTFNLDMDLNTFLAGLRKNDKPISVSGPKPKNEPGPKPVSKPAMTEDQTKFTSAEKAALISHLEQYMGTEPEDSSWDLSIDDLDSKIVWCTWYSVQGFNYGSEDEYSISAVFTLGQMAVPISGFERLDMNNKLFRAWHLDQYITRLGRLAKSLSADAKTVWVKDNGAYEDPEDPLTYYSADLELVFEGVMPGGRNIHLHYCSSRTSPF